MSNLVKQALAAHAKERQYYTERDRRNTEKLMKRILGAEGFKELRPILDSSSFEIPNTKFLLTANFADDAISLRFLNSPDSRITFLTERIRTLAELGSALSLYS